MAAQPLAWFEGTGLPDEAFLVAPAIKKYLEIQSDFHNGNIFPIGDEPSGTGWCGFQSIQRNTGYFLVFREANDVKKKSIKTWLPEGTIIKCEYIMGNGKSFSSKAVADGVITFNLPGRNNYALYKYFTR